MEQACRRKAAEIGDLALELSRQPHIVGVEEGDEVSARPGDAFVPRTARAAVALSYEYDPIRPLRDPQRRIVGRAVVDDDDLEFPVALCEHRGQGRSDGAAGVERRNDD